MDRSIVYPGSIPLDTDLLSVNRNAMIGLGALLRATLGTQTVVDGLACAPTAPLSMTVTVGPGSITSLTNVDATAYGSIAADTTDPLVKMGINLVPTSFTLAPPSNSGQAINYLIEASFAETDNTPVILPYYNAANPALPYSGPANAGTAQNTQRVQRVALSLVPGAAAAVNFQTTPTPDAGYVGLYVVTVYYGQTTVGSGSISVHPLAPFVNTKLPLLSPGQSSMQVITSSLNWTPPNGTRLVRLRMAGGGGGGGNGGGGAGGGGAGGGTVNGFYSVTPGVAINCTVGAGGGAGSAGGASSFGAVAVAGGGGGGAAGGSGSGGAGAAGPGSGAGTGHLTSGQAGQGGFANSSLLLSGAGGGSNFGAGAPGVMAGSGANNAGSPASPPGAGGAGGTGSGAGGAGGAGIIILEW